jgi:predicted transcriptional regulator
MNNENYITIMGWMRNELGLKGNELLVYALIYGFSQDGDSEFNGSVAYIAEWTGSTKQTVHNALKTLCEKMLIEKKVITNKGVRYCTYRTILPVVKKFDGGWSKNLTGVVKKFDGGSQKIRHNNIDDNTNNNTTTNRDRGGKKVPPTLEEVKAYCQERNSPIDPEYFYDYYESLNWMRGKTKVKDWQATLRTWERRERDRQKKTEADKSGTGGSGIDYDQFIDVQ